MSVNKDISPLGGREIGKPDYHLDLLTLNTS